MSILIKNCLAVLPIYEKGSYKSSKIERTNIFIEGKKIVGIGNYSAANNADKVIDGTDKLVIPGLINAHTHSYMSVFRNVADDLSFMDWLFGTIDPLEAKLTPEDAYYGAKLAIMEMMRCGTTTFSDMQMHIKMTSRAVKESGMRAVIGRGLVGGMENGEVNEAGRVRLDEAYEEMEDGKDCDRLYFRLAPHAPYTCDPGYLKYVAKEAKDKGLGIHIHLSESVTECENTAKDYGCSPIEYADRADCFEVPCVAAHCVQATDSDIALMAKKGVSVVSNPASNMKLGNGFAPIKKMLDAGVNVCLGTDGAASNNSLNMFHELSLMTLIHKGTGKTPQCISAQEGFAMATINGAKALGLEAEIGTIEVGKKADLAILDLNTPSLTPRNNLIAGLCYSANGSEVDTVIIDGEITMENRKILTFNEDAVYAEIDRIVKRLELDKKEY